ncbi:Ig-like domain-containing protein, partial [Morganella psychrotolerans]|uniref:Ig-like domain-containing protein n=1 Tax=Morganella psychrotolerans TaxID=368603 RepID=UPI0039AFEA08
TLTSLKAGPFTVTATINGSSQNVTVTFIADNNTAHIAQNAVSVEKNNALADGTDTDRVKVIVTDAQGNPLAGQTITADAGTDVTVGTITATNAAGETEFTLTSLKAGPFTVTATINGSSQSVTVTFVADENTAQNAVSVEKNNALADGTDTDRVKVIVTDAKGNPLAGQTITADAGADVTVGTIAATNAAGETEFTLTSLKAGPFTVTATINGSSQSVTVTFVADENTAHIAQNAV